MLTSTKSFKQGIKQKYFSWKHEIHMISKHSSQLSITMTHENKTWVNNKCECTNIMWRSYNHENMQSSSKFLETWKLIKKLFNLQGICMSYTN